MFESKRPLFITVALDAGRIRALRQFCLFGFKATMCVMTAAAGHCTFQYLVVEGLAELGFGLSVTAHTKLGFVTLEHPLVGVARVLLGSICRK